MKYALRIVGLIAIAFALYIVVGEQLVGSSSNAYINTRLATLRMPIDGTIQLSTGPIGGRLSRGEARRPQLAEKVAMPRLPGSSMGACRQPLT